MDDCLGRVPYASCIALVLCWVGSILYSVITYRAMNATLDLAGDVLRVELGWLDAVQLALICLAAAMLCVATVLLVVGALATGATRRRTFSTGRARAAGRTAIAALLALTYALNVAWLLLGALTVALSLVFGVFASLCARGGLAAPSASATECIDLSLLGPLLNGTAIKGAGDKLVLCGGDLQEFCALADTASTWYYVSLVAVLIVLLGLLHFIACLSANYAYVKDAFKTMELQEIWQLESKDRDPVLTPEQYRQMQQSGSINVTDFNGGVSPPAAGMDNTGFYGSYTEHRPYMNVNARPAPARLPRPAYGRQY